VSNKTIAVIGVIISTASLLVGIMQLQLMRQQLN